MIAWIKKYFLVVEIILILIISFAHLFLIDQIPRGLHHDEASVALNAATISESGKDEYGTSWPLYFKAFGEYKNPIYIYTAAGLFKIFGISYFSLKLTSFLFFIIALIATYLLVKKLFKKNYFVQIYTLLAFGFLPQYFSLSRVSFEAISQLGFVSLALLLIYHSFSESLESKFKLGIAFLSGIIIGLSVYTYTTARVLSFLMVISIFAVYHLKIHYKRLVALLLGILLAIIPWVIFLLENPSNLTNRFTSGVSYLNFPFLPDLAISLVFIQQYLSYFSPYYLFSKGDPILRHTIGYGGAIFVSTGLLMALGIFYIYQKKLWQKDKFLQIILINFLLSPLAAALTWESTPHSLRSLLMGIYIVIISGYGLHFLLKAVTNHLIDGINLAKNLIIILITLFFLEILNYQYYYFVEYPQVSVGAFESYNFPKALESAIEQKPLKIIVSNGAYFPYTHLEFAKKTLKTKTEIPIIIGEAKPYPDSCLIYYKNDILGLEKYSEKYSELMNKSDYMGVRCYLPEIKKLEEIPETGNN